MPQLRGCAQASCAGDHEDRCLRIVVTLGSEKFALPACSSGADGLLVAENPGLRRQLAMRHPAAPTT
jgi:hypothetical protein